MDPLLSPFRPGAGSPPPALVGRDPLINQFGFTMRRALAGRPDKSLMPIGLRGVGKTVLLNRFAEIASDEGMQVAALEAGETGHVALRLAARLRSVVLALDDPRHISRLVRHALGAIRSFSMQLPHDGPTFSNDVAPIPGVADSGILSLDIPDLLVTVGKAAADRRSGVLLSIDEIQYLSVDEFGALIMGIHRTAQLNLPVVLIGAGLPQLPALAGEAKSYAERLFNFPEIGALEPPDAVAALIVPTAEVGVPMEPAAAELIVAQAGGYPYFLQTWGYHVWNQAEGPTIRGEAVKQASDDVYRDLDQNFFRVRYDQLTPKEKQYLRAMAELGPGPHRSGDIAAQLGVRVESVGPRRSGLIQKGMIYSPAHGDTAFTVPLFDEFLKRAMPVPRESRR